MIKFRCKPIGSKELESESKGRIDDNREKINILFNLESDNYVKINEELENDVHDLVKEQEKVTGATEKLSELEILKVKYLKGYQRLLKNISFSQRTRFALHVIKNSRGL